MSGKEMHGKLNLEEVGRYFENKGYKMQKLEQLWRHVTGQVKFENEKLFLKLASTKEIGERTRNEKSFNESANSIWKKYIKTFQSPKVFKEAYKWTEKNDKEFAPVLASRIMGGYFDAERDGVTSVELNREMEERLYGGVM